ADGPSPWGGPVAARSGSGGIRRFGPGTVSGPGQRLRRARLRHDLRSARGLPGRRAAVKRGFVTETHVVIYCDGCGDPYTENTSESICFASVHQAVSHLSHREAVLGWIYDGDRVWCDGCRAAARCE